MSHRRMPRHRLISSRSLQRPAGSRFSRIVPCKVGYRGCLYCLLVHGICRGVQLLPERALQGRLLGFWSCLSVSSAHAAAQADQLPIAESPGAVSVFPVRSALTRTLILYLFC